MELIIMFLTKINLILTFYWPIILLDFAYVAKSSSPIGLIFFFNEKGFVKTLRNDVILLLYKRCTIFDQVCVEKLRVCKKQQDCNIIECWNISFIKGEI